MAIATIPMTQEFIKSNHCLRNLIYFPQYELNSYGKSKWLQFLYLFSLWLLNYLLSRYKLLRTQSLTSKQAFHLQSFEDDFDYWQPIKSGFSTDIMVGPNQYGFLSNQLKNQEIKFDIVMDDIGAIIESQRLEAQKQKITTRKNFF